MSDIQEGVYLSDQKVPDKVNTVSDKSTVVGGGVTRHNVSDRGGEIVGDILYIPQLYWFVIVNSVDFVGYL